MDNQKISNSQTRKDSKFIKISLILGIIAVIWIYSLSSPLPLWIRSKILALSTFVLPAIIIAGVIFGIKGMISLSKNRKTTPIMGFAIGSGVILLFIYCAYVMYLFFWEIAKIKF